MTDRINELRPAHPDADAQRLQFRAFKALHQESTLYATCLRYEGKFERQYDLRARRTNKPNSAPAAEQIGTNEANPTPRNAPRPPHPRRAIPRPRRV